MQNLLLLACHFTDKDAVFSDEFMMKDEGHSYESCSRAFSALAIAYETVARHLETALSDGAGMSINEFDVLMGLSFLPEQSLPITRLGEIVRLSQSAISRLVDRLENRGLIDRHSGNDDKRNVVVRLTDDGLALFNRALPIHQRCIQESLLAPLDNRERGEFKNILLKLANISR